MAKVTHVQHAQQRYEMVPVLDDNGEPKRVPVMSKRTGEQKKTKRGALVFRNVTIVDKTKPLPPEKCGKCRKDINVGDPYKWIAPKSGPYGGRRLVRCEACPSWHVWEYSSSTSARIAQVEYDYGSPEVSSFESEDDAQTALNDFAEAIREIAQEKEESADSIESGFGHETYVSQEIREVAEQLNSWADEVEQATLPDFPEVDEEVTCDDCGGTGQLEISDAAVETEDGDYEECQKCEGTGSVDNEDTEPSQDALDAWREEVQSAIDDVVSANPL